MPESPELCNNTGPKPFQKRYSQLYIANAPNQSDDHRIVSSKMKYRSFAPFHSTSKPIPSNTTGSQISQSSEQIGQRRVLCRQGLDADPQIALHSSNTLIRISLPISKLSQLKLGVVKLPRHSAKAIDHIGQGDVAQEKGNLFMSSGVVHIRTEISAILQPLGCLHRQRPEKREVHHNDPQVLLRREAMIPRNPVVHQAVEGGYVSLLGRPSGRERSSSCTPSDRTGRKQ